MGRETLIFGAEGCFFGFLGEHGTTQIEPVFYNKDFLTFCQPYCPSANLLLDQSEFCSFVNKRHAHFSNGHLEAQPIDATQTKSHSHEGSG